MTIPQLRTIARDSHPLARLHAIYPEVWRRARAVRRDARKRRVRISYGKPWLEGAEMVGLVVEFRWPVG